MASTHRFAAVVAFTAATLLGSPSRAEETTEVSQAESLFDWQFGDPDWESPMEERDRIHTDRPHISEATSTVGLGRVQLETGYSYFQDANGGNRSTTHSFPEPLLRVGMLADWFELRLGYNYLIEQERNASGISSRKSGSDDMLLAAKIALVKQRGVLPDVTVFPQMRLPTGRDAYSADQVLPGVNIAYCWAVTECIEIECNSVFNQKRDDAAHTYSEYLQTLNIEYDLSDRWLVFTEYLAFMPSSSQTAQFEHYFHTGVQYFLTPNVQFDVHSAVGLNRAADNLAFTGVGFCVRW